MKWPAGLVCLILAATASAADYRSVSAAGAIMYDAPSAKAKKLYVVAQGYPVEIVVSVEGWVKVRDLTGELAWIQRNVLTEKRTVVVTAPVAEAREAPDGQAPVEFRAQKGVALDLLEIGAGGWVKVRHRDGQSGFVPVGSIWGL